MREHTFLYTTGYLFYYFNSGISLFVTEKCLILGVLFDDRKKLDLTYEDRKMYFITFYYQLSAYIMALIVFLVRNPSLFSTFISFDGNHQEHKNFTYVEYNR